MALSNGLYEIRPYIAQDMCVDVSYASDTPGANVLLWGASGSNNQKFYFTEETTDHWSIRCIKSGQYLDVYGGTASAGANVCQWPDLDSANQRWLLTDTGQTVTVYNSTCHVVTIGSWADGVGTAYNIDVDHALTSAMTNVLIWTASSVDNQKFVLVPTATTDPRMPIPSELALANEVYGEGRTDVIPAAGSTVYPSWSCVQSWLEDSDNDFEFIQRYRTISNDGTYSQWSWSFTNIGLWPSPNVARGEGLTFWHTDGLGIGIGPNGVAIASTKAIDFEMRVRSASATSGYSSTVHGQAASAIVRVAAMPVVTIDSAKFAPDGLHVAITSDYRGSYTNVLVTDLAAGSKHYVSELLVYEGLANSDEFVIPMGTINDWIAEGTELTISYRLGTEMMYDMGIEYTSTLTSAYMDDGGLTVTKPSISLSPGRLLEVQTTETLDSVWMVTGGAAYEAHYDDGAAYVPYPFGEPWEMFVCVTDGTNWGFRRYTVAQCYDLAYDGSEPCHAWSWDGGWFILEHQTKDTINTSRTIDAQADTYSLDTREWQTLSYSPTAKGTFKAAGVLVPEVSESTVEQLLKLAQAHHVIYRAPSGEIAHVGVTQVSYDTNSVYTKVTVTSTQETV